MNSIRPRLFSQNLESALKVLPVTVVTGARQTGKTTLVKMLGAKRGYLTLDDVGVLDQVERDPNSLLASRPVILDEVQRAPQLLLAVSHALVCGVVLHAGKARPLDKDLFALPWGWMVKD